ncbi:2488_t:CDS:2 [Gigaspora rosea]|nr:2488_t:CDS:2 [Gigaspora rosea]
MESSSVENKPIFYALTVMEPFATCIIHGPKRLENRTYPLDISSLIAKSGASVSNKGVWIAIHVSSSKRNLNKNDPTCLIIKLQCWEQLPSADELKQKNNFGKIIGVARFIDCLKAEDVPDDNVWKGDDGGSGSGKNKGIVGLLMRLRLWKNQSNVKEILEFGKLMIKLRNNYMKKSRV